MKARLYNKYVSEVVPALKEKHKYLQPAPDSAHGQDRGEYGRQRVAGKERGGRRSEGPRSDHWPQAGISKSRHNIANFKLRLGQPIGCRVTLRKDAMYEFFDGSFSVRCQRIRYFRDFAG
jgi:large subunit ribosomal protein L5